MGSRLALAERKRGDTVAVHEQWGAEATRELRDLYQPLRRFAAVIGRWDVDPDDLVQEAYAKVLRRDPAQIRDLGPYMRRAIANLATDERRRKSKVTSITARLNESGTSSDSYPSDLEDLMRIEPRVRALLFLVECEGHQIADAAEIVGMTNSNARVALMRARRRLRSELALEANGE